MSISKTVLNLRVRKNSARAGVQAFQAEVVPHNTYEGTELYARLSDFLGYGKDGYRARSLVQNVEAFIRQELEQGNRLDFGLVSFFPKLSAALPTQDADPDEAGLFVRGGVKARKALSASMADHLLAKNPEAGDPIWISSIYNETLDTYDLVAERCVLSVAARYVTVDPSRPDEGIWLEKQIKRRRQKHIPLVHAEIIEAKDDQIRCRFAEVPSPGKYNFVVGTRGTNGPDYKLRFVRHVVRVA